MKKALVALCLIVSGCFGLPGEPYTVAYSDDYRCEVTYWEKPFTQEICEEVWCYDDYYQEWYLYDEYCY